MPKEMIAAQVISNLMVAGITIYLFISARSKANSHDLREIEKRTLTLEMHVATLQEVKTASQVEIKEIRESNRRLENTLSALGPEMTLIRQNLERINKSMVRE